MIRVADHLCSRRIVSICPMISDGVLVGCWCGVEDRSSRPISPCLRYRLTHLDAHAREIPISSATCAIGRVRHRSTRRRRPSTDKGELRWSPIFRFLQRFWRDIETPEER